MLIASILPCRFLFTLYINHTLILTISRLRVKHRYTDPLHLYLLELLAFTSHFFLFIHII